VSPRPRSADPGKLDTPTRPCHDTIVGHVPVDRHEGLEGKNSESLTFRNSVALRYPDPLTYANSLPSSSRRSQDRFPLITDSLKRPSTSK
jgi:hypothetical protein